MRIGEWAERAGVNIETLRYDPDPKPGVVLHVTNGDSAGNTLRRTTLGGAVLPWQDVLHDGPVPAVPPAELREVRARFLAGRGWGSRQAIRAELELRDRLFVTALADRRPVVLWFEHDLYDQLQLIQILALAAGAETLELIQVDSFPGRPTFHGLGELTADELETLWPQRVSVTPELVELAGRAWDAVREPEPSALAQLLDQNTSSLPFLAAALRRLLEELPDARSGLSRTERQLLEALFNRTVDDRRRVPRVRRAGRGTVCRRRVGLPHARGAGPLVTPLPPPPPRGDPRTFMSARAELTDAGRAVLAGEADRVDVLGIVRWVGGTHLVPGRVWRWDGSTVIAP
jgi:hypothetical protein